MKFRNKKKFRYGIPAYTGPFRGLLIPYYILQLPNAVVEWLTLVLYARKVPGLNLGPETGYPD
jgi:hypothetical protein